MKLYNALVNKVPGIASQYHAYHDGTTGLKKFLSYIYLIWLNFAYHILRIKSVAHVRLTDVYEEKRLLTDCSESEKNLIDNPALTVDKYVDRLKGYDVISFDIFDTLIFRAVSVPTDLFWFLNEKIEIIDIKRLRTLAEYEARKECFEKNGHCEVTFKEIWEKLSEKINVSDEEAGYELELEKELCFANPFMLKVWERLIGLEKDIVVTSDMYLPESFLKELLEQNGFKGFKKIYVSNEYKKSKAYGNLYDYVKEDIIKKIKERGEDGNSSTFAGTDGEKLRFIHVGDNPASDEKKAKEHGFDALLYPKIDRKSLLYRPYDMSDMVGSAYRALINYRLYNGLNEYSVEYEYGYVYGGLFVTGYCHFIHEYCKKNGIDKKLFLSRDGDILKQAYDLMYPGEDTEYVYWSRKVATKFIANFDRNDYLRRFVGHKINQNIKIRDVLGSMELDELTAGYGDADEILTLKGAEELEKYLEENWKRVLEIYEEQKLAAKKYYENVIGGAKKVAAIDIGWAGSGALSLSHMVADEWDMDCRITGILAGTNTVHNAEPDATEPLLQQRKLVAYLFSQADNRDLLKKHDLNKNYNVFWELLLSSPTPGFNGFYPGNSGDVYLDALNISLKFGEEEKNKEGIIEIQKGILDFVKDYDEHFSRFPYMLNIYGRDAYAPMILAASHDERYLKMIEKRFSFEVGVN